MQRFELARYSIPSLKLDHRRTVRDLHDVPGSRYQASVQEGRGKKKKKRERERGKKEGSWMIRTRWWISREMKWKKKEEQGEKGKWWLVVTGVKKPAGPIAFGPEWSLTSTIGQALRKLSLTRRRIDARRPVELARFGLAQCVGLFLASLKNQRARARARRAERWRARDSIVPQPRIFSGISTYRRIGC